MRKFAAASLLGSNGILVLIISGRKNKGVIHLNAVFLYSLSPRKENSIMCGVQIVSCEVEGDIVSPVFLRLTRRLPFPVSVCDCCTPKLDVSLFEGRESKDLGGRPTSEPSHSIDTLIRSCFNYVLKGLEI